MCLQGADLDPSDFDESTGELTGEDEQYEPDSVFDNPDSVPDSAYPDSYMDSFGGDTPPDAPADVPTSVFDLPYVGNISGAKPQEGECMPMKDTPKIDPTGYSGDPNLAFAYYLNLNDTKFHSDSAPDADPYSTTNFYKNSTFFVGGVQGCPNILDFAGDSPPDMAPDTIPLRADLWRARAENCYDYYVLAHTPPAGPLSASDSVSESAPGSSTSSIHNAPGTSGSTGSTSAAPTSNPESIAYQQTHDCGWLQANRAYNGGSYTTCVSGASGTGTNSTCADGYDTTLTAGPSSTCWLVEWQSGSWAYTQSWTPSPPASTSGIGTGSPTPSPTSHDKGVFGPGPNYVMERPGIATEDPLSQSDPDRSLLNNCQPMIGGIYARAIEYHPQAGNPFGFSPVLQYTDRPDMDEAEYVLSTYLNKTWTKDFGSGDAPIPDPKDGRFKLTQVLQSRIPQHVDLPCIQVPYNEWVPTKNVYTAGPAHTNILMR